MTCKYDEPILLRKLPRHLGREGAPPRRHEYAPRAFAFEHGLHAVENRLSHHDHSRAAPEGVIVGVMVLVFGILADVVRMEGENALRLGPAEHAGVENAAEHFGEESQNVNPQTIPPPQEQKRQALSAYSRRRRWKGAFSAREPSASPHPRSCRRRSRWSRIRP